MRVTASEDRASFWNDGKALKLDILNILKPWDRAI